MTLAKTNIATAVTAATNRVRDPSFESGIGAAQGTNNASLYPFVYDTAKFLNGTRSIRCDRSATTPSNTVASIFATPTAAANICVVSVAPGEIISVSGYVWCSITGFRAGINAGWRDSANGVISTTNGPVVTGLTPSAWNLIKFENVTAPALNDHVAFNVVASMSVGVNTVGGEQVWFDSMMMNTGTTVNTYFDGNTAGCSWSGTAHRSASNRAAVVPYQLWDGSALTSLSVEGVWNGTSVVPTTFATVEIV